MILLLKMLPTIIAKIIRKLRAAYGLFFRAAATRLKKVVRNIKRQLRKKHIVKFDSEFGMELQVMLPYAYYLHQKGKLDGSIGCRDTRCFYYFSPHHEECLPLRGWKGPDLEDLHDIPNSTVHTKKLNTREWLPPPYKKIYENQRFVWRKPTLVICNKYNYEWGSATYNFLSLNILKQLIHYLYGKYQVIYNRPTENEITDEKLGRPYPDFEFLRQYCDILTTQQLHRNNSDLSFNQLQMMIYANTLRFISVQGGNSVLASYFGGNNVIYIRKGLELACGDYNHYSLYSGAKIHICQSDEELMAAVKRLY